MKRLIIMVALATLGLAAAQTEIEFWHAFGDEARSGWIEDRAREWSEQNPDFEVVVESRGSYRDTLNAAVLAARQGEPPHIVQVFEVGSQQALDSGLFEPIGNIGTFETSDYIEPVLNYYTINGTTNSIPFNSSNPILYMNEDMMQEAGLDPENRPRRTRKCLKPVKPPRKRASRAPASASTCTRGFSSSGWRSRARF